MLDNRTTPTTLNEIPNLFNDVRSKLFTNFPIYNENHRIELQNLIMGRFLNREICEVPYARWQFMFNQKMMEIMPYFNRLYQALEETPEFNIFDDVNYKRTIDTVGKVVMEKGTTDTSSGSSHQTNDGTFDSTSNNLNTDINTPQSELTSFLDNKYLTSAAKGSSDSTDISNSISEMSTSQSVSRTGSDTDIEDRKVYEHVIGKRGGKTYVELIKIYRDSLFTVDNMILDALEEMFFMIY